MNTTDTVCQSCGMPLARDPKGGGTNADGSRSTDFCSYCWDAGKFTAPKVTLPQMQERVRGLLSQMGMPTLQVDAMTAGIPKLARWKT